MSGAPAWWERTHTFAAESGRAVCGRPGSQAEDWTPPVSDASESCVSGKQQRNCSCPCLPDAGSSCPVFPPSESGSPALDFLSRVDSSSTADVLDPTSLVHGLGQDKVTQNFTRQFPQQASG